MDVCGRERVRLDEPWTPRNRAGRWSWWNWDSRTANPEDYARSYDVVSVGNPRPPHVPQKRPPGSHARPVRRPFESMNAPATTDMPPFNYPLKQQQPTK